MKNKMKSRKSVTKRFKKLGSGKLKRKKAHRNHKAAAKSKKQRRQLAKPAIVNKADQKRIEQAFQG